MENRILSAGLTLVCAASLACADSGVSPGATRFGQVGEVRVRIETPLQGGVGELQQALTWNSRGSWQLFEQIGYQGRIGDAQLRRSPGVPAQYAAAYATFIAQMNEAPGLSLFVSELDQSLSPDCGVGASRVTLTIRDETRGSDVSWVRCVFGSLVSLRTEGAGPDPQAGRVVQAVILAREFTLGELFESAYRGSLPFNTIERGVETGSNLGEPQSFRSLDGKPAKAPDAWFTFWNAHKSGTVPPPEVNWEEEMVLVGAVGVRQEAGDSVEIRRVVPIDDGTRIELFETIPGDFCAPAARITRPFHIVLAPRTPAPIVFAETREERVPCGTP